MAVIAVRPNHCKTITIHVFAPGLGVGTLLLPITNWLISPSWLLLMGNAAILIMAGANVQGFDILQLCRDYSGGMVGSL